MLVRSGVLALDGCDRIDAIFWGPETTARSELQLRYAAVTAATNRMMEIKKRRERRIGVMIRGTGCVIGASFLLDEAEKA